MRYLLFLSFLITGSALAQNVLPWQTVLPGKSSYYGVNPNSWSIFSLLQLPLDTVVEEVSLVRLTTDMAGTQRSGFNPTVGGSWNFYNRREFSMTPGFWIGTDSLHWLGNDWARTVAGLETFSDDTTLLRVETNHHHPGDTLLRLFRGQRAYAYGIVTDLRVENVLGTSDSVAAALLTGDSLPTPVAIKLSRLHGWVRMIPLRYLGIDTGGRSLIGQTAAAFGFEPPTKQTFYNFQVGEVRVTQDSTYAVSGSACSNYAPLPAYLIVSTSTHHQKLIRTANKVDSLILTWLDSSQSLSSFGPQDYTIQIKEEVEKIYMGPAAIWAAGSFEPFSGLTDYPYREIIYAFAWAKANHVPVKVHAYMGLELMGSYLMRPEGISTYTYQGGGPQCIKYHRILYSSRSPSGGPLSNYPKFVTATQPHIAGPAITLLPNPAQNTLRAEGQLVSPIVFLYNVLGKGFGEITLKEAGEASIISLTPGVYIARFLTTRGPVVRRFVKE